MKTKKRWGRKGFALFLALLLALSPAAAFANSSDGTDELQPTTQTVETTKATEPETNAGETKKPETKPEVTETKAPEKETEQPAGKTKATKTTNTITQKEGPNETKSISRTSMAKGSGKTITPYAQNTGHRVSVRFVVLYLSSEFNIGYNFGSSESTTFVCQYSVNHSDTAYSNHTIAISDIRAAANRLSINSGYEVEGWTKTASKNPSIYPFSGSPTACNKGATIYIVAKQAAKTFTLNYDANGGSGAPSQQTETRIASSYDFTISSTIPTRTDHKFLGWSTNSRATSPSYDSGGKINVTGTTTLYAVWQKNAAEKVTLTYDGNGNTGGDPPASQTEDKGTQVTIQGKNTLKRGGYEFLGWNTDRNATSADWSAGDTMGLNANVTFYAVWKLNAPTDNGNGISITKTRVSINGDSNKTSAEAGDEICWEVKVTNNSNVTKTVTLIEQLAGVSLSSNRVTLAPGKTEAVTATYTVKKADSGTLYNTVVASTGDPGDKENPEAKDEGTVINTDDGGLEVTKTRTSADTAKVGDTIEWKIAITNTANVEKTVVVADLLNNGKTVILTDQNGSPINGNVVVGAKGTVELNASYTVQESDTSLSEKLRNTVTVTNQNNPSDTATGTDEGTEIKDKDPTPSTTLEVTKTADKNTVEARDPVKYTITVENTGSVTAEDVTVTDVLDRNLEFQGATLNGKDITPTGSEYTIGTLAAGETATLVITAKVSETVVPGTEISNTATADHTNKPDNSEPPSDTAKVTVVDQEQPGQEYPQLEITKTADPNEVKAGEDVVYTITVTNNGTVEAKGVTVRDTLPEGLTWKNAVLNDENTIDNSPTNGVYSIGDLGVGSSATLTITATVDNSVQAGTTITNTATADAANDNPDEDKPSASVDVTVSGPEEQPQEVTLTFIVVNGSWNDGTATTITKPVSLTDGKYTIVNGDVPAVGEKPNDGYRAGSWDPVPNGATVTTDTTYTYTYEKIETDPTDETDPTTRPTNPTNPTNPSQPTDPTNPTDPTTPSQPTDPTNPTDPTDPTTPSEPTDPTDPTDPATPTEPTEPQDPTEPTTPVTPVGPTTPTDPGTPSGPNTPNTPADPNGPAGTTGGTATVANVPTVTPAAIPAVAALAPAAAPAAPAAAATVADDAVPLAAEPEGVTTLADDGVPLAKGPDGAWALLNFALMNLAIFECLMLLIGYFIKTKGAAEEEEEENKKLKKKGVMRIISLPIAAISLIAFCLTEDITLPTAIVDRYTLLMAIIALVQTVAVVLSRKELKDETDDETEERAVA